MSDLSSRSVLVTGSSSGFGLLTARTFLDAGATVFATMRDPEGRNAPAAEELRDHADQAPGTVHVLDLDVTDDASVTAAVARAEELAGGALDVVVNNAGVGVGGLAEGFTAEQWTRVLDINVVGVQRVNRAVLPEMRAAGRGLLVHVSSVMGRIVIPFSAVYTASKFALEGLAETYRYELAATGVDVTVVEPGGFGTSFAERMVGPDDEARLAGYGEIADLPEQMWSGFMEQLHGEEGPDPQLVADAIRDLAATPAGERPLRVVVDPMSGGEGPRAINEVSDQVQAQLLEGFGMANLRSVGEGGDEGR